MDLSRREFIVGTAVCAGCVTLNRCELEGVRLAGDPEPVLVWRTADGFGAASVVCTHRGYEVALNAREGTLDCPCHGSRFNADGSIRNGPARQPLRHYLVDLTDSTLRLRLV